MKVNEKINALRRYMKQYDIAAYIVPSDDFHGSEYVGAYFKTREYLSGFTGSAGTLVVLSDKAALWTDGRYFLQAKEQLKDSGIELMCAGQPGIPKIAEYLQKHLEQHSVIGFDGRTVSNQFVNELAEKMQDKQITFTSELDLAGMVWKDRPAISTEPVWELLTQYAGLSREEKLKKVRDIMEEKEADILVLTAIDEIAWLLNLRGNDVMYTPVFLSYMIITKEKTVLCVHEEILSKDIREKLGEAAITVVSYDSIDEQLTAILPGQTVWCDESRVNYHLTNCFPKTVNKINEASPVEIMKAIKTPEEMANIRIAHIKDGVAVTRFIYWLKGHVGKEKITELSAAEKLNEFRMQMDGFLEQSFEPIIAYGTHGAIVHYSATKESDVEMKPESFCLADTGGHYMEGTTDITRTIALGELTEEEKRLYTLVLRGNLNLGAATFMYGVCGQNLDYLAREPLWENHLDFNHGTGHGVGYLMNVHEGPQRVHWRITENGRYIPLEEGMVISNEPGIYLNEKFGIRHENLVLCRKGEKNEYGQFMYFETLTMVPFDRDAIVPSLMREDEISRLNAYHKRVYETLSPYMKGEEFSWLAEVTSEIQR